MVDATSFVKSNDKYLKVENVTGKVASDRTGVIVGEAYFDKYIARNPTETDSLRLVMPVEIKGEKYLVRLSKTANTVLVAQLGGETMGWIGAIVLFSAAGTGKPYISVDVLQKPSGG